MKGQSKCPECKKVFTKKTQKSADCALRMHVARVHSRTMIPRQRTGRRTYSRRKQVIELCFCPRCGTNLQDVATAMAIVGRNK